MDELHDRHDGEERDEDAALARDDFNWFARQLGEQWESDGDGIYRFVGQKSPLPAPVPAQRPPEDPSGTTEELGDALAPARHARRGEVAEPPSTQKPRTPRALWWRR